MSDSTPGDDRSMSEILSSIRRIVTDEERSRREADEGRRRRETESDGSVLVLTDTMRSAPEAPQVEPIDTSKTLVLGAAQAVSSETPAAAVDFSEPALSEGDIEDIVRRVVREELQGPIGQQISRKVKRLIRNEVEAALSEDELT